MEIFQNFNFKKFLIIFAFVIYFSTLLSQIPKPYGEQHFSYLALSFLNGKTDINNYQSGWNDTSVYNGNHYWPLGPFPAALITPLVLLFSKFNILFYQKYLNWLIVLGVFCLIYKISRKLGYGKTTSVFWAFVFNLGSVFIGVSLIPWSWYFSQVVCTFLIFAAIYEYLTRKRYFILGIIFSFIFLTRITAFLGIILVVFEIAGSAVDSREKLNNTILLLTPIVLTVFIFFLYNFSRFGKPLEQGYGYQVISGGTDRAREYGLISLRHVPGNLYYFLIAPPKQVFADSLSKVLKFPFITMDEWGMGILFTSIYLIKLFFISYKNKLNRNLLLTSAAIAIPIFMYYGVGFRQYGYRYSLDFLPYLFLILMNHYRQKGLSLNIKTAMVFSIIMNIFLLYSVDFVK
jgi:hypothetical protein